MIEHQHRNRDCLTYKVPSARCEGHGCNLAVAITPTIDTPTVGKAQPSGVADEIGAVWCLGSDGSIYLTTCTSQFLLTKSRAINYVSDFGRSRPWSAISILEKPLECEPVANESDKKSMSDGVGL